MAGPLLLPLLVCQPSTGLCLLLAVASPLLLPLLVFQPGTGLCVVLAVAVLLLLPVLVCQPGTGLCVVLAVAISLLLPVLVCQLGTGLCVLFAITVPLLLPVLVCQPGKLMHFDLMCLHTNLHLHRILCKLHNNFRCYKFILHDKFLILRFIGHGIEGETFRSIFFIQVWYKTLSFQIFNYQ
jgi:hypothetical protein